jgi:putative transposase
MELFFSVADAREKLEKWREEYNTVRPHSSLANLPPAEFAAGAVKSRKQPDYR